MKTRQTIAVFVVLGVFLVNMFFASVTFFHFKYNQSVIAKTLCVQKEKEVNTCQGNCHLKKELEKVVKKKGTSSNDFTSEESHITNLFNVNVATLVPTVLNRKQLMALVLNNPFPMSGHTLSLLDPPKTIKLM